MLEIYRPNITALENERLATTKVVLEGGHICRKRQCILGNILTEAMVYNRIKANTSNNQHWTDAAIAFYNAGGIRSSIEFRGHITFSNVLTGLPFQNNIIMAQVHGSTILKALERSAEVFTFKTSGNGGFLQMYGAKVIYNMNNTIGRRVKEVRVLCADCNVPRYHKLDLEKKYKILLSSFLYNGGDSFNFKENNTENSDLSITDADVVIDYLRDHRFLYSALDERIAFSAGITLQFSCFIVICSILIYCFE